MLRTRLRRAERQAERRAPAILGTIAAGLAPWMWWLGRTLPAQTVAYNWPLAWTGLDTLMATGCLSTAVLVQRGDARAGLTAAATATVCVIDAWFDICTSAPGVARAQAGVCAVGELALAGYCVLVILAQPVVTSTRSG